MQISDLGILSDLIVLLIIKQTILVSGLSDDILLAAEIQSENEQMSKCLWFSTETWYPLFPMLNEEFDVDTLVLFYREHLCTHWTVLVTALTLSACGETKFWHPLPLGSSICGNHSLLIPSDTLLEHVDLS